MSLKDNFNQAIKEIMKKELVGKNLAEEAKKDSSLDSVLGQNGAAGEPPTHENGYGTQPVPPSFPEEPTGSYEPGNTPPDTASYGGGASFARPGSYTSASYDNMNSGTAASPFGESAYNAAPYADPAAEQTASFSYDDGAGGYGGSGGYGGGGKFMPPPQPHGAAPSERQYNDNEETTVISKNIVINGGTVTGFANVRIDGSVKGDVKITKDVNVTGKVVGDIECNNAVMAGSSIQGSVLSKGQLRMDRDSVLLGDVNTAYLDMNGRIKGTVDVSGKAEFKADSVIIGDITASTITVLDGAVIKGYVNTTFLQESSQNVFPDAITVSDQ